MGLFEMARGLEAFAIDPDRIHHLRWCEMRGEGIGPAEHRRELRAEKARSQNPDGHVESRTGDRPDPLAGLRRIEIMHQLYDIVGKLIRIAAQMAPQRLCRRLIGARRAPESEIDPPGKQARKRAELLCDDEWRVVGQHDPAGPDPDGARRAGDIGDDDRRRGTGDARHVVVLGQPVTLIAERLGMDGELAGPRQRRAGILALGDRGEIENRQTGHAHLPLADAFAECASARAGWQSVLPQSPFGWCWCMWPDHSPPASLSLNLNRPKIRSFGGKHCLCRDLRYF